MNSVVALGGTRFRSEGVGANFSSIILFPPLVSELYLCQIDARLAFVRGFVPNPADLYERRRGLGLLGERGGKTQRGEKAGECDAKFGHLKSLGGGIFGMRSSTFLAPR